MHTSSIAPWIAAPETSVADLPALTFYEGAKDTTRWTYGELYARVDATARWLAAKQGIEAGAVVGLLSPNEPSVPVFLLALLRLGATILPLNINADAADGVFALRHARARYLITSASLSPRAEQLASAVERVIGFDSPEGTWPSVPDLPSHAADHPAIVLYTSGTTGNSKGVVLTQRNVLENARLMARRLELRQTT